MLSSVNPKYSHVQMILKCPDKNCSWVKGMSEAEHSRICTKDLQYFPEDVYFREEHINGPRIGTQVTFIEKEAYAKALRAINAILIADDSQMNLNGAKQILRSAIR